MQGCPVDKEDKTEPGETAVAFDINSGSSDYVRYYNRESVINEATCANEQFIYVWDIFW